MAFVPVDIAPELRPWYLAGISELLLSNEAAHKLKDKKKINLKAQKKQRPDNFYVRQTHSPVEWNKESNTRLIQTDTVAQKPQQEQINARESFEKRPYFREAHVAEDNEQIRKTNNIPDRKQQNSEVQTARQEFNGITPYNVQHVKFSPVWQSLWEDLSKRSPKPLVIWTYAELGTDLRGKASTERSAVLRRLISAMNLPQGSNAFWPTCLPPDNLPEQNMFLAGLYRFNPRAVLMFGESAANHLRGIGPLPTEILQNKLCNGYNFFLLQDMQKLSSMKTNALKGMAEFLRRSIT